MPFCRGPYWSPGLGSISTSGNSRPSSKASMMMHLRRQGPWSRVSSSLRIHIKSVCNMCKLFFVYIYIYIYLSLSTHIYIYMCAYLRFDRISGSCYWHVQNAKRLTYQHPRTTLQDATNYNLPEPWEDPKSRSPQLWTIVVWYGVVRYGMVWYGMV